MAPKLNPFETHPRVFISYARSDGEQTARSLRARLEADHPEITLWLDRARMQGGLGWWQQISEALDSVEILIMVLTPGALQSDTAAKEWRYARQQGVRVCPVRWEASTLDFARLPSWMRKAHCYDLSREWDTFVSYLHSPGKTNRVPFMSPDLPDRYVERPIEFRTLLSQVLDESGQEPLPVTTALHGAGGFGKTTLACMLCHDAAVINAFDDGVLWVRLGESPNLQGELTKLYAALTGERPPFVDVDDAAIQLATRLDGKSCLMVIDDVWDPNHLKPFLRGGAKCCRVITTRQLDVVSTVGAIRTAIDRMTAEEALTLLTAKTSSVSGSLDTLRALAERLGGWPLLLKLVGAQLGERVERGDSMENALTYVNRALERRGVVAFDRTRGNARNDAVASTVAASLELFSPEEKSRCARLAIFRSDTAFPLSAVSTLWELDAFDSEELLLRLDNAALLEFDLRTASIRLHNVLRSYFETLNSDAASLHAQLAARWLRNALELPDAYAWTWIGWHLAQGRQLAQLEQLLMDFAWLRARLNVVPVQILLQDFELLPDSTDLKVVRDALRLASDGLSFDRAQLRVQLCGRIDRRRSPAIDRLLDQAHESELQSRLDLADTSLTHPGGALTGILKSHVGGVEALAVAPAGRWIASGSQDWSVRLWDVTTGSVVRTFEGHKGIVHAVGFTPEGRAILSGSEDRTLRLWDVATGEVRQQFRGHTLAVRGIAIAANGRLAYSASEDGTIREWDLSTGRTRVLFKGRSHQLGPIVATADGTYLIFGAGDWSIQVMDLSRELATRPLEGHSGVVRSLALTSGDEKLISGSDDGALRLWSLDRAAALFSLTGHQGPIDALATTADGKYAISGSQDRTLRVWDLGAAEPRQVLKGHSGFIRALAVSALTGRVVSGSTDCTIRQWEIGSESVDRSPAAHDEAVSRLAISSEGARALSGSGGADLVLWSVVSENDPGRCVTPHVNGRLAGHTDRIQAVQLTPDGALAVTGSRDRTLRIWDLRRALTTHVLKGHTREILDLKVSVDGRRIVSFSRDRTLRAWDVETGRAMRALVSEDDERALASLGAGTAMIAELETGPIVDRSVRPIPRDPTVAISPDGAYVVLGSQGNVCIWNLLTGASRNQELGDLDIVAIEIGPDSERIVMGSLFGPVLLWRPDEAPVLLEGHSGRVLDVVLTPDGRNAVSAASDDTIRIWNLETCKEIRRLQGCVGQADAVAIAPNGDFAYSIYGHTLAAYDLASCARVGSMTFDHQITTIAVTPSGTTAAVGDLSGRVHFLSLLHSAAPSFSRTARTSTV